MLSLSGRISSKSTRVIIWTMLLGLSACVNAYVMKLLEKKSSLSDAECHGPNMEYKANVRRCECVDGTYGDPDFFCTKSLTHFCTIRKPQIMQTFQGDRYFFDYPCLQTVAEIHMTRNNEELNVNVFVSSAFDQTSNIVLEGMGIQVSNLTVYFTKDEITVNGVSGGLELIPDHWKSNFRVVHNAWIFSLTDLMVLVRPFDGDNSSPVPPGLQVAYNGDTHYHVHEVYELCSHVVGEFEDAQINMGYKYTEIYALKLSMDGYDQLDPDQKLLAPKRLRNQCDSVSKAYAMCIIDHQTITLNRCGPLLTNSVIRLCFTYSGYDVMDIFNHCVKASCELDSVSCEKLRRQPVLDCYTDLAWCSDHILAHSLSNGTSVDN